MKKIMLSLALFMVGFFTLTMVSCGSKDTLYVLNWGDYMDPDLISAFEKEFNVRVVYEEVGSNEEMEIKLKQGITKYDIIIPSDYMIDKLSQEDLLMEINYDLLPNLSKVNFFEDATKLYQNEDFGDYLIPYFFGTIGIMYNESKPGVAEAVQEQGFCALFDENSPYRIGLYDSPRDTIGAALLCLGYSVNSNNDTELGEAQALISSVLGRAAQLTSFGQDSLKKDVAIGNLDMALVYSGDYFEMIFAYEEDDQTINFNYFAPNTTNIWIDAFVIPKVSQNPDLAHQFINFFLDKDNAVQNADWVGYTPVIEQVYDTLVNDYEYDYDHYYPQPEGSFREVFHFISAEHAQKLNTLLNAVKTN